MHKLCDTIVATRAVCAETSLVLVSDGPDLGDQDKAGLGTDRMCPHYFFTELVHLTILQPSCSTSELNTSRVA